MNKHAFDCALVTGASTGIGREFACLLAEKGIDLIIVARSGDKLESLESELSEKVNVEIVVADLADREQRKRVLDKIYERVPGLVVNNAGWGYYGEALTYETEASMNLLEVDVAALLEISLEAARAMVTNNKKGVIMNVSSSAAFQIMPCFSVYAASKAFVNLFSESFDGEMKPYGIRVLACCPGMVDTKFRYRASDGEAKEAVPFSMTVEFAANEMWKQIEKGISLRAFDWKYRLSSFLTRYILPKRLVAKIVQKQVEKLHSKREIIPINKEKEN
jgi:short-subunit dehydrogenase